MEWQLNPYVLPLIVGAMPLFGLAFVAWQRGNSLDIRLFCLSAVSTAGMILSYAMELLSANEAAIHFWLKVEYFFLFVPGLWLLFVLAYTGHENWVTTRNAVLIFIPSTIQTLAAWTNPYHHLNWATVGIVKVDGLVLFERTYGAVYILGGVYFYVVALASIAVTIRALIHAPRAYRTQLGLLLIAVMGPLLTFTLTTLDYTFIDNFDITPFGFVFAYFAVGWSLLRYRLLDLVPTAHHVVMNSITDAILVIDSQDRIVDINPAGERFTGRRSLDIIGRSAAEVFSSVLPLIHEYQDIPETHSEIQVTHANQHFTLDMMISPIYTRGHLTGRVVVLHDITRRKQIEETIRQYAAELELRNSELDAYSYTVAHDLKTPLQIILGYAELLYDSDHDRLSDEGKEYLDFLQESALRLKDMISGLLLLAQLRDADTALIRVDIEPVMQRALDRFSTLIEERAITVEVKLPLAAAAGHPLWLEEVFANLISNAVKYIGQDNPKPRIVILSEYEGDMVRYDVTDNGIGIAPEDQARLFEMFTRFNRGEAVGTGLGLSIVQRIITKLHGKVRVQSMPGVGSTFSILLPAADPHGPAPASASEPAYAPSLAGQS